MDNTLFNNSFAVSKLVEIASSTVEQTVQMAKDFAEKQLQEGAVVCLIGDLGAGKTHFVKGLACAFGADDTEVNSPTYTIVNEYDTTIPFFHFDLYRLNTHQEVVDIGFEEYLYSAGICVIEWPDLVVEMLPTPFWLVQINSLSLGERQIVISQCT